MKEEIRDDLKMKVSGTASGKPGLSSHADGKKGGTDGKKGEGNDAADLFLGREESPAPGSELSALGTPQNP